jgi:hypothetical protein
MSTFSNCPSLVSLELNNQHPDDHSDIPTFSTIMPQALTPTLNDCLCKRRGFMGPLPKWQLDWAGPEYGPCAPWLFQGPSLKGELSYVAETLHFEGCVECASSEPEEEFPAKVGCPSKTGEGERDSCLGEVVLQHNSRCEGYGNWSTEEVSDSCSECIPPGMMPCDRNSVELGGWYTPEGFLVRVSFFSLVSTRASMCAKLRSRSVSVVVRDWQLKLDWDQVLDKVSELNQRLRQRCGGGFKEAKKGGVVAQWWEGGRRIEASGKTTWHVLCHGSWEVW